MDDAEPPRLGALERAVYRRRVPADHVGHRLQ
jgi:hypothetical protein